jgi:hypothetical protein
MEVAQAGWLTEVSRFTTAGHIYPGWILTRPLLGIIERDQAGHYYISNEGLGLYAVGLTQPEALDDFTTSLIDNYRFLAARAGGDPDLEILFQKYQKYLQIEVTAAGERLTETFYILSLSDGSDSADIVDIEASPPLEWAEEKASDPSDPLTPHELFLLASLVAEYRTKLLPTRLDLAELDVLERKLKRLMALAAEEEMH